MSELEHDASVAKDVLLQTMQKSIYFEKRLAASNAPNYTGHCSMALPAWFVIKHGDKFRRSVLLRFGSSIEASRVQLSLSYRPPCSPAVKFSGGWRTFATVHGLVAGDSLVFCLRAMSEFDVYVRREITSLVEPSSFQTASRKRSYDFELQKEQLKTPVGFRHRNLVAGRSEGRVTFDMEKRGAPTGSGENERLRGWQGKISFEKILRAGAVSGWYQLTLPVRFVQQHGDKIQEHVILQSVADRKMWSNVKVNVHFPDRRPQVVFHGGAWKAFVVSNGLVEGDQLTFTLVAMSKFEVLILRSGESPNTYKRSVKLERELSAGLFAKALGTAEDSDVAYSASNDVPESDSSQSPSDMDSSFFEGWSQRMSKKLCRKASTTQIATPKAKLHFHASSSEY